MKKIINIISLILLCAIFVVFGVFIFKKSNIDSVEIVGDIQTIYFANTVTDVNFNDAELKISYKDGSVKMKKLTNKIVKISNFNTSVVNNGTMKISYKSHTIDVDYAVISSGLYYLSEQKTNTFNGSSVTSNSSGALVAGVDKNNKDITTSIEMINFNLDGTCDYYTRASKNAIWYMDDGYFDKTFYYSIVGNCINVQLGENNSYELKVKFSNDGDVSLESEKYDYLNSEEKFVKSITERSFKHYEMKGNRTFSSNDISVWTGGTELKFKKNSSFDTKNVDVFVRINYSNDNFLKTVYVRFNESMFKTDAEFDTSVETLTTTRAVCIYDGVFFDLRYSVYD